MNPTTKHGRVRLAVVHQDVPAAERAVLGRGRSGIVYRDRDPDGTEVAAKCFRGDRLADLVHLALSGAPCPYRWNANAAECARLRRQILALLVRYWFGSRLAVAEALGVTWNDGDLAWELRTRFIDGYPAALHHPFSSARDGEQRELAREIMAPLQRHLEAAGFDGLVWQAGRGNPVAANNFLLHDRRSAARAEEAPTRWYWIDLESGVPALFALDPRALFGFYLPRSWRFRRPLFDDVDTARLRSYLDEHEESIDRELRAGTTFLLRDAAARLAAEQRQWRSLTRLRRSLGAALAAGRITEAEAVAYRRRPVAWLGRELTRFARGAIRALADQVRAGLRRLAQLDLRPLLRNATRLVASHRYRARLARHHVLRRVRYWQHRGQLGRREAAYLRRVSHHRDQATFLTDFGVHLAIKPVYKPLALVTLPLLGNSGVLPLWAVAAGIFFAGSIARTSYTLARVAQAKARGLEAPWVALAIGALPLLGSAAFPAQLLHVSRSSEGKLAALIVYDTVTAFGRRVPIWGGADTATEHFFNRLPDLVIRDRGPLVGLRRSGS